MRVKKIRPHHILIAHMLDGIPHSPEELIGYFNTIIKLEKLSYRIPQYLHESKKFENTIILVAKSGRNVISYTLINTQDFNEQGQNIQHNRIGICHE